MILDNLQNDVVTRSVTTPRYLVEIELNSLLFLSTRDEITVDGNFYQESEVNMPMVSAKEARIEIWNENYQYTASAMNGRFLLNQVRIYWAYPYGKEFEPILAEGYVTDGYFTYPDIVRKELVFSGFIVGTPEAGEWLKIECSRNTGVKYPRVKLRRPIANHLAAKDQVIKWDGSTYRISD